METTEKKKHKSGYDLLKEKYAKLEKERDEWKAKFERKSSPIFRAYKKLSSDLVDTEKKLDYLLKHCPFWVRWMYRKQFEKGDN